jgi:putative addiction module CopG family antidote
MSRFYPYPIDVTLTPDQQLFVREAIASGRLQRQEDAVKEALSLWEERERRRSEILSAVDEAEASIARGERLPFTAESMRELAEEVKRRGRARLAAEHPSSRGWAAFSSSESGFRPHRHLALHGRW